MFDDTLNTEQNCQSLPVLSVQTFYKPVHGPGQTVGEINVPPTGLLLVAGKYYLGCFGHLL